MTGAAYRSFVEERRVWRDRYCVKAPSHRLGDKPVQICDAVIDIGLRLDTFVGNSLDRESDRVKRII